MTLFRKVIFKVLREVRFERMKERVAGMEKGALGSKFINLSAKGKEEEKMKIKESTVPRRTLQHCGTSKHRLKAREK